ncbi:hypothetical protein [Novosphingobium soli]|uniref:Uncharacterized protein n=1 Tax=Novosphingobium soli TaxID=574956 RepID=A0ABV6CZT7_9SPHN
MMSAPLVALVLLSGAPSPAAAYAGDTVVAAKGHPTPAKPARLAKSAAPVACHPDPSKGRVCRHNIVQAEEQEGRRAVLAHRNAAGVAQD